MRLLLAGAAGMLAAQRRRIRALEAEARADLLTGLPNRRGLAAHWARQSPPPALLLIDLVGFKAVNDSHGHIVGDALLRQVAARLKAAVPAPGLVARWGGDEFVGVVPAGAVEGVRARIAAMEALPHDLSAAGGPAAVRVGARIGVAEGGKGLEEAVAAAARALMQAKAG